MQDFISVKKTKHLKNYDDDDDGNDNEPDNKWRYSYYTLTHSN